MTTKRKTTPQTDEDETASSPELEEAVLDERTFPPEEEADFPWAKHLEKEMKPVSPLQIQQLLHNAGMRTPRDVLLRSAELDRLLQEVFSLNKAKLVRVAREHLDDPK